MPANTLLPTEVTVRPQARYIQENLITGDRETLRDFRSANLNVYADPRTFYFGSVVLVYCIIVR
jgi:hypothetical protein